MRTMVAIFGERAQGPYRQSDRAATSATRAKILAAMQTLRVLQAPSADRRVLVIGDEAWPMPIPIVRTGDRWRFATEEGEDEIVNRRDRRQRAQRHLRAARVYRCAAAYATRDRDGDGVLQYAQKLASTPGQARRPVLARRRREGRRGEPVRAADRRKRRLPQGSRGRRPVPRLSLQDPDAAGQERAGRCVQLRDQRPHDRRLRDGRLSRPSTAEAA